MIPKGFGLHDPKSNKPNLIPKSQINILRKGNNKFKGHLSRSNPENINLLHKSSTVIS
jgi:hypothetical protein